MMKKMMTRMLIMALALLLITGTAYAAGSLQMGDSGSDVKALQKTLTSLGYDPGKADGKFGEVTQQAVMAFQKANGLYADGIVGKKTQAQLEKAQSLAASAAQPAKDDNKSAASAVFGGTYVYMQKGSTRAEVRILQKALIELGYEVKNNGRFDEKTETAVMAFQKANGLYVDGVAGPDTEKKIEKALQKLHGEAETLEASKPKGTLKKGDAGDEVTALQKRLIELGYFNKKELSGRYDDATEHGVMLFQQQHKLKDDGVAGAATLKLLFSTKAERKK